MAKTDEEIVSAFLLELEEEKKSFTGYNKVKSKWADFIKCDWVEHLDKPDFPLADKVKIVEGLDIKSKVFGTYRSIFNYLRPLIKEVNEKENRPFKILEVAGGLGDLSIGLYAEFAKSKEGLKVQITGSDIVPGYIDLSAQKAARKNYPVEFKIIDALDISKTETEQFDIVIALHSIHHFTALPLFQLIKKSQTIAKYGLFAVDATQNIPNMMFMCFSAMLPTTFLFNGMYVHDAFISARKMHTRNFLRRLGTLAAPNAKVECDKLSIGLNYLRVNPQG